VKKEQQNMQADLIEFEKSHGLSSDDIYSKDKSGKTGDDDDTLIWAGVYELFLENEHKLSELQ
jgi:hypothetical protein